jgi:hypothetical protein
MFGKATLDIPQNGPIGPSHTIGLSDELAMTIGRTAAWTLSDKHMFVTVTLESGEVIEISDRRNEARLDGKVIGHLT